MFSAAVLKELELFESEDVCIWSVSEVSQCLKQIVEKKFSNIKVRGEVSGFKLHSSGHMYFSLKDSSGEAVLNAICWRGIRTKAKLEDGAEVIVQGRISTYPGRSNYQIIISEAESAGEGELLKLLMARKEKLAKEGLFNKKRILPKYPQIIGVITSSTGAVIQDILHRISERYPCKVVLWPVAVQGNSAAEQVAAAIDGLNALLSDHRPDVIIVARGGGSIADLWAFNEECVVRAAFNSQIPLISAVGHETDTTLIDYAADVRAPTPTAAAEIATPVRSQIISDLLEKRHRMAKGLLKIVDTMQLNLRIQKIPNLAQWIGTKMMRIDDMAERLPRALSQKLEKSKYSLEYTVKRLKSPENLIFLAENKLPFIAKALQNLITQKIRAHEDFMSSIKNHLQQSSYGAILKKGFCLAVGPNGNTISSVQSILESKPEYMDVHFFDGNVKTKII
jgi:exodeoxyribonuclease VII large subunit